MPKEPALERPVDFFIVGAMKAGTSSLRTALASHPEVAMAKREIHYFSDPRYANGPDWYAQHFAELEAPLLGEKSADYASSFHAPERMAAYNADAKLIFILREPVARAISQYRHSQRRTNGAAVSMEEEIDRRLWLGRDYYPHCYVFRSQYEKHLSRILEFFPRPQLLVLVFEDICSNPEPILDEVQRFLGISPMPLIWPHRNSTPLGAQEAFPIAPETRARLREVLAPTVNATEAFLARPLDAWRTVS
jgi:hypothetical protein